METTQETNQIITGKIRNVSRIHKILENLFVVYSESKTFNEALKGNYCNKTRSLLLSVIKESLRGVDIHEGSSISQIAPEAIHFGSRINNGKMERWMPKDLSEFSVQCIMDQDTFIDLLIGKDKYGNFFNIEYAWTVKEIVFIGKDWFIHKQIVVKMFEEFRDLLNIKVLFK